MLAARKLSGELIVKTIVRGGITLGDITSKGRVEIGDRFEGELRVEGNIAGDVIVYDEIVPGALLTANQLTEMGRIRVVRLLEGRIEIEGQTEGKTRIEVYEGIASTGNITINARQAAASANGNIYIGQPRPQWPSPVTFDGSILVRRSQSGFGGQLLGRLDVVGCHATQDLLDICICNPRRQQQAESTAAGVFESGKLRMCQRVPVDRANGFSRGEASRLFFRWETFSWVQFVKQSRSRPCLEGTPFR